MTPYEQRYRRTMALAGLTKEANILRRGMQAVTDLMPGQRAARRQAQRAAHNLEIDNARRRSWQEMFGEAHPDLGATDDFVPEMPTGPSRYSPQLQAEEMAARQRSAQNARRNAQLDEQARRRRQLEESQYGPRIESIGQGRVTYRGPGDRSTRYRSGY